MSKEIKSIINEVFLKENFTLSEDELNKFAIYYDMLIEYNSKVNLTAIEEEYEVAVKHFLDSALMLNLGIDLNAKIIDIGTGAGFPGVPIKILRPNANVYLFDSLQKRLNFLDLLSGKLNLKTTTVHGRAEDFAHDEEFRESFDIATARAVAKMPVLLEYCMPFVKVGGVFIALKGPELENELNESEKALKLLGAKVEKIEKFTLANGEYCRNIAIIKKVAPCDNKYPRKAGTPQKKPLI